MVSNVLLVFYLTTSFDKLHVNNRVLILKKVRNWPKTSLLIVAILCGVIWRVEVEYHGWVGLIWISYFHWAIPVIFTLFLLWVNLLVSISVYKRPFFNLVALVFGLLIYMGLEVSLVYNFNAGPSAFIMLLETPEWKIWMYRSLVLVIMVLIPLGTFTILRLFGIRVMTWAVIFAQLGLVAAVPLSMFLLFVVNHKGGDDILHTIKSGFLIPFWIFSIGMVIVAQKVKERPSVGLTK